MSAVSNPPQSIFAICLGISGKQDIINDIFINPRAHSATTCNLLCGDGHAGSVILRKIRPDPVAYKGALDWSAPSWRDLDSDCQKRRPLRNPHRG